jgi:sulfur-carrier protein adenylyltransferase/sulfurtransferase
VNMPFETSVGGRTPYALDEHAVTLKVGVVGLGSLGSRVAISLARTGVRRWVLVDGDVLRGPNICRYPASFGDVGAAKVYVVKESIREISPAEPEISCHVMNLLSPTNPDLHALVLEDLATADILIDATADPDVFGMMAMLASDKRRPLLWGEVFGGGIGGLVGYTHPEHGPCPRCVRAGFLAAASAWPPAPAKGTRVPYGDDGETPAVATDADVSFVGAALTARVLSLVAQEPPATGVTLLGLRPGWIFDAPIQSVPVPVRSDDRSCARCWIPAAEPDAELASRADALFLGPADVDDSTAT